LPVRLEVGVRNNFLHVLSIFANTGMALAQVS